MNPRSKTGLFSSAVALCAMLALAGCAGERLSAIPNPFARRAPVEAAAAPAPVVSPVMAQVASAPAAQGAPVAAMGALRVTDAPVGAGVNVQPGSSEDFIVNVGRRVFFTEGSAALTPIARETLDNQAAWLKRYPGWQAKIQGFADDPGSDAANMELGRQRAEAVMNYLVAHGVSQARLRAKSYGREADRLVRACADSACRAQNRRVITNLEQAKLAGR